MKTFTIIMTYHNDNGLLVDPSTTPPTCCGYLFNFAGHGAFAPDGKVMLQNGTLRDLTQGEVDTHNRLLGEAELAALKKHGRGIMYLTRQPHGSYHVATWTGQGRTLCHNVRRSWHNWRAKTGARTLILHWTVPAGMASISAIIKSAA